MNTDPNLWRRSGGPWQGCIGSCEQCPTGAKCPKPPGPQTSKVSPAAWAACDAVVAVLLVAVLGAVVLAYPF